MTRKGEGTTLPVKEGQEVCTQNAEVSPRGKGRRGDVTSTANSQKRKKGEKKATELWLVKKKRNGEFERGGHEHSGTVGGEADREEGIALQGRLQRPKGTQWGGEKEQSPWAAEGEGSWLAKKKPARLKVAIVEKGGVK